MPGIEPRSYTSPEEIIVPNFLPDVPAVREDLADYYESVSRWDAVVGAVLDALDASGRADETLVFVTTDHAMPFPGAKASSFDSGHHCPLLISSPTATEARVSTIKHSSIGWISAQRC